MTENDPTQGSERRPDRAALIIAICLFAVGAVLLWDSSRLADVGGYAGIGPATMPRVVGVLMIVLAAGTAVTAWRGGFPARETDQVGPIFWIVGGLAAQLLLLKTAGFSIATGLLFAATARAFGRGPLILTVPVGIALSFAIYLVFARLLQLSLPAGYLEHLLP